MDLRILGDEMLLENLKKTEFRNVSDRNYWPEFVLVLHPGKII